MQLAVSARLAGRGGIDLAQFELRRIAIRDRERSLRVRLVPDAMALPLGGADVRRSHDPARTRWPMRLSRRRSLDAPSP